jgi:hypothetical protein
MSEALTRVIAEQQAEIDQWKSRDKYNLEAWVRENKKRETLISAVFAYINFPDAPHGKMSVIEALRSYGYCISCECSPCECDDE